MSQVKTASNTNVNHDRSFSSAEGNNRSKYFKKADIEEINQMAEKNKNDRINKQLKEKEKFKKCCTEKN